MFFAVGGSDVAEFRRHSTSFRGRVWRHYSMTVKHHKKSEKLESQLVSAVSASTEASSTLYQVLLLLVSGAGIGPLRGQPHGERSV